MCIDASCSPSRSTGEISASEQQQDARRTQDAAAPAARRPRAALGARVPPARDVDASVRGERDEHDRARTSTTCRGADTAYQAVRSA